MSEFIKRDIADYLIDALADVDDLDCVKLFLRGGTPMPVPANLHPFVEVIIGEEDEGDELTGEVNEQAYIGLITFNDMMAEGDWLSPVNRRASVPSYDRIEEMVVRAIRELRKPEHADLGGLTATDGETAEIVKRFALTGPRVYGIEPDARTNNYTNYGSIPFVVETERQAS